MLMFFKDICALYVSQCFCFSCVVISQPQGVWDGQGHVKIDGKMIDAREIHDYRASGSTRDRPRVRGGAVIRAKDS